MPEEEEKEEKWKIIAFASANYLDITKVWYKRLSDLGYTEHVVGAMDEEIFDALTKVGLYKLNAVDP
jgi:hypothetical protein